LIVVDSSVLIDFFNGRTTPQTHKLTVLLGETELLIGDVILCEVLQGARSDAHARTLRKKLTEFECVSMLDPELAVIAAANYRKLRALGVTVRKTIDLIIGTCCLERKYELLHSDRDFDCMEIHLGLRVVPTDMSVHEPKLPAYRAAR
jgi:predicted nucleic acid-binding protein